MWKKERSRIWLEQICLIKIHEEWREIEDRRQGKQGSIVHCCLTPCPELADLRFQSFTSLTCASWARLEASWPLSLHTNRCSSERSVHWTPCSLVLVTSRGSVCASGWGQGCSPSGFSHMLLSSLQQGSWILLRNLLRMLLRRTRWRLHQPLGTSLRSHSITLPWSQSWRPLREKESRHLLTEWIRITLW